MGLYFPWDADDLVGEKVLDLERVQRYAPDFVLEGGSIDVDGRGHRAHHRGVSAARQPQPADDPRADRVAPAGVPRRRASCIWLPRGVYLDETNGHVDNFARFVRPGHVMLTWTDDESDPQFAISNEALADPSGGAGRARS